MLFTERPRGLFYRGSKCLRDWSNKLEWGSFCRTFSFALCILLTPLFVAIHDNTYFFKIIFNSAKHVYFIVECISLIWHWLNQVHVHLIVGVTKGWATDWSKWPRRHVHAVQRFGHWDDEINALGLQVNLQFRSRVPNLEYYQCFAVFCTFVTNAEGTTWNVNDNF